MSKFSCYRSFGTWALGPVIALMLLAPIQPARALLAHVTVSVSGNYYAYSLFNDEATDSPFGLSAFDLQLNAPLQGIESPPGWTYETDGATYVSWTSTNGALPFVNDVPPGDSLDGFIIQTLVLTTDTNACAVVASDFISTNADSVISSSVPVPSAATLEPALAVSQNNGTVQLNLTGVPGFVYDIQTSSDLVNWSTLAQNTPPFTLTIPSTNSTPPALFYRALLQTTQD